MATMGVLYDVLFKPIGRDGGSTMAPTTAHAAIITAAEVQPVAAAAAAAAAADQTLPPPEWVLDERDGGSLVWRRCGCVAATSPGGRRRVEFLDAVQVRVFERDDYSGGGGGGGGHDDGCADTADAADDDAARDADAEDDADDWCWDEWDASDEKLFHRKPAGPEDYPVLVAAVSVTVLGVCFGLAYLFAPVRWLFHQLLVD